jgi:hypothetical protein
MVSVFMQSRPMPQTTWPLVRAIVLQSYPLYTFHFSQLCSYLLIPLPGFLYKLAACSRGNIEGCGDVDFFQYVMCCNLISNTEPLSYENRGFETL